MSDASPKRSRGRPPKEGDDVSLTLKLPKDHHAYLRFIVMVKKRLGASTIEAAEHILIREINAMMESGYHEKPDPWKQH